MERCLNRLGYRGATDPSLETLKALQQAFLLTVPFENLDIHLGRPIELEPQKIYRKIVDRRRGGFCYENNTLFFELLRHIGFPVARLSARMVKEGTAGPEFDHLVLNVTLDQNYLVDVGNGQSCREPLDLTGRMTATSEGFTYRIAPHGEALALLYQKKNEPWKPRFLFSTVAHQLEAFGPMCQHTQTSPESTFTQHRLATLALPDGRVTIKDRQLTIAHQTHRTVTELASAAAVAEALHRHMGITLDE